MKVVSVVLDIQSANVDRTFDFAAPSASELAMRGRFGNLHRKYLESVDFGRVKFLDEEPQVGSVVMVPFGMQIRCAYVVDVKSPQNYDESLNRTPPSQGGGHNGAQNLESYATSSQEKNVQLQLSFEQNNQDSYPVKIPKIKSKKTAYQLNPIVGVIAEPMFGKRSMDLAKFIHKRYLCSMLQAIKLITPPGTIVKSNKGSNGFFAKLPSNSAITDKWVIAGPEFSNYKPRANAKKQIQIINFLKNKCSNNKNVDNVPESTHCVDGDDFEDELAGIPMIRHCELVQRFGSVDSTINALVSKKVLQVESRKKTYTNKCSEVTYINNNFSLTDGQIKALSTICNQLESACDQPESKSPSITLLDGVTGSGKTEVYIRVVAEVVGRGLSAIVLVPEISLTPQTVRRFKDCFGDIVAVMHSRQTKAQKYEQWNMINSGEARVVIGPRSALFAPVKNLGIVIIDEEHETTYKQDITPRYDARICAEHLCETLNIPLVYGTATPSIRALYNCKNSDMWVRVKMPERTNKKPLPKVHLVDMTHEFKQGSKSIFSVKLKNVILDTVSAGQKAILLYNRRGFANYMFCRNCGYIPQCPNCETSLTLHESTVRGQNSNAGVLEAKLVCHHCGYKQAPPVRCPECNSVYIAKLGCGTQGLQDNVMLLLAQEGLGNTPIIRMDADTVQDAQNNSLHNTGHQQVLDQFAKPGAAVLIGTQMIAKGLDFDDVALVGVVLADTELNVPDFSSTEKTFNMICQVAGRCGRGDVQGCVIVQTYKSDSECIVAACNYDRARFLADELPKRQLLCYPPFFALANIVVSGPNHSEIISTSDALYEALTKLSKNDLQINRPTPCTLSKLKNQFRYHIVVRCAADVTSKTLAFSDSLKLILKNFKHSKYVQISVDIDPATLL